MSFSMFRLSYQYRLSNALYFVRKNNRSQFQHLMFPWLTHRQRILISQQLVFHIYWCSIQSTSSYRIWNDDSFSFVLGLTWKRREKCGWFISVCCCCVVYQDFRAFGAPMQPPTNLTQSISHQLPPKLDLMSKAPKRQWDKVNLLNLDSSSLQNSWAIN